MREGTHGRESKRVHKACAHAEERPEERERESARKRENVKEREGDR